MITFEIQIQLFISKMYFLQVFLSIIHISASDDVIVNIKSFFFTSGK